MKLLTAIPAVLLLCTISMQALAQNNLNDNQKQQLLKANAYLMHTIEARQTARLNAAHASAAKTTDNPERLIAHSYYLGTLLSDSATYTYSGDRSSTFDFNSMQYVQPALLYNVMPMNMSGLLTVQEHNGESGILFDSSIFMNTNGTDYQLELLQYDANNNIIQFYSHYPQNSDSLLTFAYSRSIDVYDANGNITSNTNLSWDGGVWDTVVKRSLTYNGNKITSDTLAAKSGTTETWGNMYFWSYSYDNSGNLTDVDVYANVSPNSQWEETERYSFYYNPDNTIQKDTLFIVNDGSSQAYTSDSVGYTAGVNYITYEQTAEFNNGGDTSTQYVHITNGLPDTLYSTAYGGYKITYTYDSHSNPLVATEYDYFSSAGTYNVTPSTINYYYYQQYTTAVNNVAKQNVNITVYPNPATNEINISQTGIQQGAHTYITLINALGQTVHSESLPWMSSTETISVAGLVPGNYWLVVQDKGGNVLSRQAVVKE